MKRENFIKCAEYLREYATWEKNCMPVILNSLPLL